MLLVTGVIAARVLGVQDRGHLALFFIVATATTQIGSLGIPLAATYELALGQASQGAVVKTAARVAFRQALAASLVHFSLVVTITWHMANDIKLAGLISVANSPAILTQQYGLAVLQGLRAFRAFNFVRLIPAVAYAALAALAWGAGSGSLVVLTLAWTISTVLASVLTVIVALAIARTASVQTSADDAADAALSRRMRRFGIRSVLASASPVETLRIDQAAVGLLLSPAALGLYVTGVAFTNLPRFLAQSLGIVAFPNVAAQSTQAGARRQLWRFTAAVVVICGVVVAGLALAMPVVLPALFGREFAAAVPLARVLLLAALLISIRRVLTDGARGIGQPGSGTIAEIVSWVALLALLPLAVPSGVQSVAWTMVASAALSCIVMLLLVTRPLSVDRLPPADQPK